MASLHRQPLLVVLRADQPLDLSATLERLQDCGVRHVEVAWSPGCPDWARQCRQLVAAFPELCLGAASVCGRAALEAVANAELRFAVSPVFQPDLLHYAAHLGLTLVPGVFSPTEVCDAIALGCTMVKLFPAISVGPAYWRRLAGPLGPLPFCIAAGGLGPVDLPAWLSAGVDAVAIGGELAGEEAWSDLRRWTAVQPR
ncbi:MAG: hypothetical protein RLZZ336_468 [Cyanobacteriota bacterium]